MKILEESPDSEYMATKVPDTNGCYVVPAFTGLGAPIGTSMQGVRFSGLRAASTNTM